MGLLFKDQGLKSPSILVTKCHVKVTHPTSKHKRKVINVKNQIVKTPSLILLFSYKQSFPTSKQAIRKGASAPCNASLDTRQACLPLVLLALTVLLRLATVSATTLVALLHASAESDVDARRGGEAEGFGDLDEVEAVDVEDAA